MSAWEWTVHTKARFWCSKTFFFTWGGDNY